MKKILIIQPTEVLNWEDYSKFIDYVDNRIDNETLVLNKNMTYEVIEIGE